MKLYLAGLYTSNFTLKSQQFMRCDANEQQARRDVRYYLESYHYIHRQAHIDRIRADGVQLFLDSGAFSAFTKGVQVDLPAYCEYIHRNMDIIEVIDGALCASVLDGIGDPKATYANQKAMEQLGVKPLPCFHYGEPEEYLDYYVANYSYITLGGMVPISTPQLRLWLDRIWEKHLIDGSGRPKIKVHGFGLTVLELMGRYPWYSVDSSSWVQIAANGNILIPGFGIMATSDSSPSRKMAGQHIDTIPAVTRNRIKELLHSQGFDLERMRTEYVSRWVYNCWSFTEVNRQLENKETIFSRPQPELFS